MSIGFNLSLSDLMLVDNFAEAFGKNDKETIYKILEQNGFDTSMGVEEVVCQHRNLQGKVVNCLMYQGHELSSTEWLRSGNATWNNVVEHSSLDLRIDLKRMGQNYNNTGSIINEMQKHAN
jgi:hypothetical protein